MSSDTTISVNNLGKCYHIYNRPQDRLKQSLWRGRKQFFTEFWALRDISFEINKGETIGIIGRNGSGKSTLLQLIAGTATPTTGSVDINGRVAALLELGSGFNPEFSGRENVFMNGAILGISREEMEQRFDEIAAFAAIGDFIDQPVKTYSSGMLVRLAFAVSVNVEPDILIVDEALAVGDMAFKFKCTERLDRLVKSGTTLLFVSHDLGMVKAFCNEVIYLENGSIKALGPADQVTELYILDLRDEQKQALSPACSVKMKKSLCDDNARIAFGTEEGRIVEAAFADSGSLQAVFKEDEQVELRIVVEYLPSVKNPTISIVIQDKRLIAIFGRYFAVKEKTQVNGLCSSGIICSFRASLISGDYHVTVRLEDRLPDNRVSIIEKQVGLLSFNVSSAGRQEFLGIVDMDMHFVPINVE